MDSLVQSNGWFYYTLDRTNPNTNAVTGCDRFTRETGPIKQMRLTAAGIVEVNYLDEWGGICREGFTTKEANVLCKQFGFELGASDYEEYEETKYNGPIHIYDLNCNGEEYDVGLI